MNIFQQEQIKELQAFINKPQTQLNEIYCEQITAIAIDLCENKCRPGFHYAGSTRCTYCYNLVQDNEENLVFPCSHSVHSRCFEIFYTKQQNYNSFDPLLLKSMACKHDNICFNYDIGDFYLFQVFGKNKVEKRRKELLNQLVHQLEDQDKQEIQKKNDARKFQCQICIEEKNLLGNGRTLDCNHVFCDECLTQYLQTSLDNGKFQLNDMKCPQCPHEIETPILRDLLPKETYDKICELRLQNLQNSNPNISYVRCPGLIKNLNGVISQVGKNLNLQVQIPGQQQPQAQPQIQGPVKECPSIMEMDITQHWVISCLVCKLKFCIHGCNDAHEGKTCDQYREWKIEQKRLEEERVERQRLYEIEQQRIIREQQDNERRRILQQQLDQQREQERQRQEAWQRENSAADAQSFSIAGTDEKLCQVQILDPQKWRMQSHDLQQTRYQSLSIQFQGCGYQFCYVCNQPWIGRTCRH